MENVPALINELRKINGARFIGVTYTQKKTGEKARYTLAMGVDYVRVCSDDITELEIRLRETDNVTESMAIVEQIASLRESIAAKAEGREHVNYAKKGVYVDVCPGVQLNTRDNTLEIKGFEQARKVLEAGEKLPPRNYRSELTERKDKLRRSLKVGKFKTLSIDPGHIHSVRLNGETLEIE
jgi:hypothetical protein